MSQPIAAMQLTPVQLVRAFFEAKERHDIEATMVPFTQEAVYTFPLSASGDPKPWFEYKGKDAIRKYQQSVLERFSQIRMIDPLYTASTDGHVVFVEARGEYIAEEGNTLYNNVYVFKFVTQAGKFTHVYEYANPVTYAKLAGLSIG